jgi:hypothetical protein
MRNNRFVRSVIKEIDPRHKVDARLSGADVAAPQKRPRDTTMKLHTLGSERLDPPIARWMGIEFNVFAAHHFKIGLQKARPDDTSSRVTSFGFSIFAKLRRLAIRAAKFVPLSRRFR